eukprot:TRINITY_DN68753_c0_g1_i1.p1 TRINITY_DN68753_c0_g1~~TRINITY_DN68753_c0_g1_i1.p1  ORF type:complete len:557 (-),score=92.09 TRINITY_DN68753_c0_g1_i1:27-1697(-)
MVRDMFFAALLFTSVAAHSNSWRTASASCTSVGIGKFHCKLHLDEEVVGADATALFQDSIATTGWAKLRVIGRSRERLKMAFAAGFVEGALTAERTYQHMSSYQLAAFNTSSPNHTAAWQEASAFLLENDQFVRQQIRNSATTDPYWAELQLVYAQLDGLLAGNNEVCGRLGGVCLNHIDYLFLQAEQDLSNIIHKPFADDQWTEAAAADYARMGSHCSSVIRMAPGNLDMFMGHNTWTGYYSMLRVLKEYDLPLGSPAQKVAFSGYFGQLYSGDDFYTLSSGLAVQETTNALYNMSTASLIQPNCVLTWARTIVANRQATDGHSWVEWFSHFNSGTINNQWQIVAMHLFRPGHPPADGVLTVLEQMPGHIAWADKSDVLREQGWWVSYNSPYFAEIRAVSGADSMERQFGDAYSYTRNPRAKIFARDMPKAQSLAAVKQLLRYNDWKHDPLSAKGYLGPSEPRAPENAIAARYDLHPWSNKTKAFGNTDGKICAASDCLHMSFEAVSGPTADQQPPFAWTGRWASEPHVGQPTTFNFTWITWSSGALSEGNEVVV